MRAAAPLVALLLLGIVAAHPVRAHDSSADETIAFADSLFDAGDYYRAITEYERVAFHHPQTAAASRARFRIALSYYRGGKFAIAAAKFREFAAQRPDDPFAKESALMAAESDYRNGEYASAIGALGAFVERHPAGPETDRALILLGRCRLREGDWNGAAEAFRSVPPGSASGGTAAGREAGARRYPDLRPKSPALAGTLSALVPGAGQLYVGRTRDAAAAFLLNAAFVWAAVASFEKGNDVAGGILVAFEAGWYSGNIFNAVGSAHKYNRRLRQQFLDDLDNRYGRSERGEPRGLCVRVFAIRH